MASIKVRAVRKDQVCILQKWDTVVNIPFLLHSDLFFLLLLLF